MNNLSAVELVFNSIACIGLMFILKYGSILAFIRNRLTKINFFRELFSCSLCLGFWSGLITGLVTNTNPLLFCFYGAAICWTADMLLDVVVKLGR